MIMKKTILITAMFFILCATNLYAQGPQRGIQYPSRPNQVRQESNSHFHRPTVPQQERTTFVPGPGSSQRQYSAVQPQYIPRPIGGSMPPDQPRPVYRGQQYGPGPKPVPTPVPIHHPPVPIHHPPVVVPAPMPQTPIYVERRTNIFDVLIRLFD